MERCRALPRDKDWVLGWKQRGTPHFVVRDLPCEMCPEIPRKAACPAGAACCRACADTCPINSLPGQVRGVRRWPGWRNPRLLRPEPIAGSIDGGTGSLDHLAPSFGLALDIRGKFVWACTRTRFNFEG